MSRIESRLDTGSEDFRANAAHMRGLVDDLEAKVAAVRKGGGEKYQERHTARGKLLVRDRIDALVDPGSPFLELSQLAALDVYDTPVAAAGVVTGVGRIAGQVVDLVRVALQVIQFELRTVQERFDASHTQA